MNEMSLAIDLAKKAGDKILEIYEDYDLNEVIYKEGNSPLTKADIKANKIIVLGIKNFFPDDGILTEEEADDKSRLNKERVWIIDPLDGTKEFIKKNGEFTVNIALTQNNKVIMGVIYTPVTDEMYYAFKGKGAFQEIKGEKTRITVSKKEVFPEMKIMASRSHMNPNLI